MDTLELLNKMSGRKPLTGPEIFVEKDQDYFLVDTVRYLNRHLCLDDICEAFNSYEPKEFRPFGDYYSLDISQVEKLKTLGLHFMEKRGRPDYWYSYNWDNNFTQDVQGCHLYSKDVSNPEYVLIQIHQYGDARGNMSDAKLFKLKTWWESFLFVQVYGTAYMKDGKEYSVDNLSDFINLCYSYSAEVPDNLKGEEVDYKKVDHFELDCYDD